VYQFGNQSPPGSLNFVQNAALYTCLGAFQRVTSFSHSSFMWKRVNLNWKQVGVFASYCFPLNSADVPLSNKQTSKQTIRILYRLLKFFWNVSILTKSNNVIDLSKSHIRKPHLSYHLSYHISYHLSYHLLALLLIHFSLRRKASCNQGLEYY